MERQSNHSGRFDSSASLTSPYVLADSLSQAKDSTQIMKQRFVVYLCRIRIRWVTVDVDLGMGWSVRKTHDQLHARLRSVIV